MIREIYLKNWQSIGELSIPLAPISVFRGESRAGKSAILRAIRAVVTNPKGARFIRRGATSCTVMITTDKGRVTWFKEKGGAADYTVEMGDQRVVYQRVLGVPADVLKVLNIGPVSIDKDAVVDINYSSQHSPHFLLNETGSFVAKSIGKITNVDEVAAAQRLCAGDLKNSKIEKDKLIEQVTAVDKKLEEYRLQEVLEQRASSIKAKMEEVGQAESRLNSFDLAGVKSLDLSIKSSEDRLAHLSRLPWSMLEHMRSVGKSLEESRSRRVSLSELDLEIGGLRYLVTDIEKFPWDSLAPMRELGSRAMSSRLALDDVRRLDSRIAEMRTSMQSTEQSLASASRDFATFKDSIGACPLCSCPSFGNHGGEAHGN